MFVFRKIWRALFSWNTRFEIRPFYFITDDFGPYQTNMKMLDHRSLTGP